MLSPRVPALELVVQTTRDSRTGEESRMCWVEYSGSESGACSAPVPRRSRSHRSSKRSHGEVVVTRRARSASRGRVHGIGLHGSEKTAVSQYHVEVRSSKGRRGSISREGRSRRSSKEVDIEHVTVYSVEDRHRSKSRSRKSKSKKSKRSKSKSRRKHCSRSRSRSTSRSRRSMSMVSASASMGDYPRIEYAEPSTSYPMLTYHPEDVHIVHASPPPELSYIPSTYHQPQSLLLDAPLVTTTGPGEDHYPPGVPRPRYFVKAGDPVPTSPVLVSTHHATPVPGGSILHHPATMHGAIQNGAELRRQHIYSSDSSDAAIHHDHERRYTTSGSAHGHGFAVSAKYHSGGSHGAKRHSYHSSSTSSSTTDSSDDAHRRTVHIGTEHLRNHSSGRRSVRVRYGGEKEHLVDVGVGYKRDSGKRDSVSSASKKGGLRSKLKSAAPFLTAAAAGMSRRGSGSSTSSKSSSSSSSTTSTSSSD